MDDYDKIALAASLPESFCDLSHGPHDLEKHLAVDFIVIPMGLIDKETNIAEQTDELVIPVCKDCQEGLNDPNWALLYCLECNHSQWVLLPISQVQYTPGLNYFQECPHCKGG